ncbi:sensor histidine kinase [Gillisia sp. CAL575]|uniref:sensor histidine kinase n=1 Tax=Gillisia sp. CAL575 TaxID=985255 RepID=UPI000554ABB8|nr:histidine kinase [Gillisia sp. CAL575]
MKLLRFLKYFGKKTLFHGILWIAVLLFFSVFFGVEGASFTTVIEFSLYLLPITIFTTYTFVYYIIPKFLLLQKYVDFVLYSLCAVIFSCVYIIISTFYGLVFLSKMDIAGKFPISKSVFFIITAVYIVVLIACAFTLLKNYYVTLSVNKELNNSILQGELQIKEQQLKYLKMQIHPHFLFNTLNTLYAFALHKNEKTPEMILQLSNLLDYIIYQTQKPQVFLTDEIKHLQDFIEMEKNRFQDRLKIKFTTEGISEYTQIPPMLFLPFLENSFKHGKDENGNLIIDIKINQDKTDLSFEIINSKGLIKKEDISIESENGIGLENVKQRLDLLFKDKYALKITNQLAQFKVNLKLQLKEQ